jgi:hypothetical protein
MFLCYVTTSLWNVHVIKLHPKLLFQFHVPIFLWEHGCQDSATVEHLVPLVFVKLATPQHCPRCRQWWWCHWRARGAADSLWSHRDWGIRDATDGGGAVEQCPEGTKLTKNDGRWKSSVVLELLPLKFSSWLDLACALLHPLLLLLGWALALFICWFSTCYFWSSILDIKQFFFEQKTSNS